LTDEGLIEGEILTYQSILKNSSLPQNMVNDFLEKN